MTIIQYICQPLNILRIEDDRILEQKEAPGVWGTDDLTIGTRQDITILRIGVSMAYDLYKSHFSMDGIIEDLNWRYATDKYDPSKKISQKDLETLLEVLRLAPSSYGLQPLKIIVVLDPVIRARLRERSWNQSQITDASHLLILCSQNSIKEKDIDDMIANTAITRELEHSSLTRYSDFLKRTIGKMQGEHVKEWNIRQAYIALGHLLHACAQLKIDSTPMEGFDADAYSEILDLKDKQLKPAVVCAIGYRSSEDEQQHLKKVRKSLNDLVDYV